ncbi:ATP-binding protein [Blastococcus sp. SYSU DS1021]
MSGHSTVTVEELRTLFLFEELAEDQLRWLARRGDRRTYPTGALVFCEGDPADHLHVLLDGGVRLSQRAAGQEVTISATTQRGAYGGAMRAFVPGAERTYVQTMRTTVASSFFRLPAADFAAFVRAHMPMAVHLLDGLFAGVRASEATVRRREHLASLGALSAGLAHELNNPATAAVRAADQLRRHVDALRRHPLLLVRAGADTTSLQRLHELHEAVRATGGRASTGALGRADEEDAARDLLAAAGATEPDEAAGVLVAAGLDARRVHGIVEELDGGPGARALDWLVDALAAESLLDDIASSTGAISALVASVKRYAHPGGPTAHEVDVHEGLENTVTMLGHKLAGISVRRDYDAELPRVTAYGAELNQVWTNLLDNAADALAGSGSVLLRTRAADGEVQVQVTDDGPGIPEDVVPRLFDAFYTTKPPGAGSGLGLDSARRIVEDHHDGTLLVSSGPQGTTFTVTLPVDRRLP